MTFGSSANSGQTRSRAVVGALLVCSFAAAADFDQPGWPKAIHEPERSSGVSRKTNESDSLLSPDYLRCEYLQNPLGLETRYGPPRFFWIVNSARRAQKQSAYQILVSSRQELLDSDLGDTWDSGKVSSDQTIQIDYEGTPLRSGQRLWWKVRSWDLYSDRPSRWSTNASFQMGLLSSNEWTNTLWIGEAAYDRAKPCPMYRSPPFVLAKRIKRATAYVSAKGVYELWLNGQRIGQNVLAPEWTDYRKRLQYQVFDVTSNLVSGGVTATNMIGAIVGEGWCSDTNAFPEMKQAAPYGAVCPQFALLLIVSNTDGTETNLTSSADWACSTNGPIRSASIYGGEIYDATQEGASPNWTRPGTRVFQFTNSITTTNVDGAQMVAQPNEPIQMTQVIQPVETWATTNESGHSATIYDMGQNLVGWCSLRLNNVSNLSGSKIVLRHAERLKLDADNRPIRHGNIDIHNLDYSLGEARQTDTYVLNEDSSQEFHPHFTYHGFRYVEVNAPPAISPTNLSLSGCVVHSAVPPAGQFVCSDPRVNKLMQNILWTIRGNLYGVMTDAPQRAEREGYLGSEMLVSQTACFDFDLAAFYTKWIRDIREAQDPSGAYAIYAPWNDNKYAGWDPGWQVGGILLPWQLYLNYGDTRILEEHFTSATNWMNYLARACPAPKYVWTSLTNPPASVGGNNISYGDWLNGDAFLNYPFGWPSGTSHASMRNLKGYGTAWAAYSADVLSTMSRVLQQRASSRRDSVAARFYGAKYSEFSGLAAKLRSGYTNDLNGFVTHDNKGNISAIDNNCQGACVMALYFDMIPPDQRPRVARELVYGATGIQNYNTNFSLSCTNHLSTGNQFAAREMLELTRNGYTWKAYEVVTNDAFPSWMYWVENGATTCWERWNSYLSGPGRGRGYADYNEPRNYSQRMSFNSFNSLPFAAVGEWIWEIVGGINPGPQTPGFRNVIICPQGGGGINWASSSLNTIHGMISCAWTNDLTATNALIAVTIPANATASVFLPSPDLAAITEAGQPVLDVPGLLNSFRTNLPNRAAGVTVLQLGSGSYHFTVSNVTFAVQGPTSSAPPSTPSAKRRPKSGFMLILCIASVAALGVGALVLLSSCRRERNVQ
jgi:alpha-L-rhamnosidase